MNLRLLVSSLLLGATSSSGQDDQPSLTAGDTLLPDLGSNPIIDAQQWEAYQNEGTYAQWRKWQNPVAEYQQRIRQNVDLPPARFLLPARALVVPTYEFRTIDFEGNTIFKDSELRQLVNSFTGKTLTSADLTNIAGLITRHYIKNQYFNSGTRVTPENIHNGTLKIIITEGTLDHVHLFGNKKLNSNFIKDRLLGSPGSPLHFPDLSRRVQILQQDPNIQRINAELKPGLYPGSAYLEVDLAENETTWKKSLTFNNRRPSSIGAEQLDVTFSHSNLTGVSDDFSLRYGTISGGLEGRSFSALDNLSIAYSRPLNRLDTTLQLSYARQDYAILDEPFNALDIEGLTQQASLGLSHPIIHTLNDRLNLTAHLEHTYSYSELLGQPFSLSEGFVDGRLALTSFRLGAEWVHRKDDHVIAFNTSLRIGIDGLGSTDVPVGPDASFTSLQFAGQYLKRIKKTQNVFLIRAGAQFAFDELPSPQKNTLGGYSTIRGYRENSLVRDSGFFLGLEYRHRLFPDMIPSTWKVDLIPFLDTGWGWDHRSSQSESLSSIGLGLRATYRDRFEAELYFGIPLNTPPIDGNSLQDQGLHFQLSLFNW